MSSNRQIGIINYGIGNLGSVSNALRMIDEPHFIIERPEDFDRASHVILPGVGAFGRGILNLKERGFDRAIRERVVESGKPLLGICLGMQLLAERGFEFGDFEGLGLIPGRVVKMETQNLRLPHVGWNDLKVTNPNEVFTKSFEDLSVYFVHSYHFITRDPADTAATSHYGIEFAACVRRGLVFGAQFHPEKSQKVGLQMLKNFAQFNASTKTTEAQHA